MFSLFLLDFFIILIYFVIIFSILLINSLVLLDQLFIKSNFQIISILLIFVTFLFILFICFILRIILLIFYWIIFLLNLVSHKYLLNQRILIFSHASSFSHWKWTCLVSHYCWKVSKWWMSINLLIIFLCILNWFLFFIWIFFRFIFNFWGCCFLIYWLLLQIICVFI